MVRRASTGLMDASAPYGINRMAVLTMSSRIAPVSDSACKPL
jgi:hypothetical protein